ncbi:hypothetical protein NP493_127g02020 [Ridgeia piscesae]|uniref:RING-type domain-containing protein n=1 Tax=Ridgeia piscesae TaxID=27915 RepID=A0AAD9UGK4_RIDPI|nr:hypothetical protein NP493_127g02020 [Ridgeia piscesae]
MLSCFVEIVNFVAVALQSVVHVNYSVVSGLFKCVGYATKVTATLVSRLTHAGVDVFCHLLQLVGEVTVFCLSAVRLLYSFVLFLGHLASLLVGGIETVALYFANVLPAALLLIWSSFTCAGNQLAATFASALRGLSGGGLQMYEMCAVVASYTSTIVAHITVEASKNIAACFETVTSYSALAGVNTIYVLKQTCAYVVSVFETPMIQVRSAVLPLVSYMRTWIQSYHCTTCFLFNCTALLLLVLMLTTLLIIMAISRKLSNTQTLRDFMFPSFYNRDNINVQPPIDDTFDGSDDELAIEQSLADTQSETGTESATESDADSFDVSEMESTDFSSTEDEFDDENDENNPNVVNIQLPEPRTRARTPSVLSKLADRTNFEEVGRILESERDKRLCVVCQDQEKNVLMLPCKHMCLCVNCAHSIASSRTRMRRICPLCRAPFHTVMNVYV